MLLNLTVGNGPRSFDPSTQSILCSRIKKSRRSTAKNVSKFVRRRFLTGCGNDAFSAHAQREAAAKNHPTSCNRRKLSTICGKLRSDTADFKEMLEIIAKSWDGIIFADVSHSKLFWATCISSCTTCIYGRNRRIYSIRTRLICIEWSKQEIAKLATKLLQPDKRWSKNKPEQIRCFNDVLSTFLSLLKSLETKLQTNSNSH